MTLEMLTALALLVVLLGAFSIGYTAGTHNPRRRPSLPPPITPLNQHNAAQGLSEFREWVGSLPPPLVEELAHLLEDDRRDLRDAAVLAQLAMRFMSYTASCPQAAIVLRRLASGGLCYALSQLAEIEAMEKTAE